MNTAIVCFYGGNHYLLNRQINKILKEEQNPLAFACRDYDELDELVPVLREDFNIDKLIILHEDTNIDRFERAADAEYGKLFESLEIGIDFSKERKDFFEEVNIPHHLLEASGPIDGRESLLQHGTARFGDDIKGEDALNNVKGFIIFPINPPVIGNITYLSQIAKLMKDYESAGWHIMNVAPLDCSKSGFWGISSIQCCSIITGGESLKNQKYTFSRSMQGMHRLFQQHGIGQAQFPQILGDGKLYESFRTGKYAAPEGTKTIDQILGDEIKTKDAVTGEEVELDDDIERETSSNSGSHFKKPKDKDIANNLEHEQHSLKDFRKRIREADAQVPAIIPPNDNEQFLAQWNYMLQQYQSMADAKYEQENKKSEPESNVNINELHHRYKNYSIVPEDAIKQAKIAYQIGLEMLQLKKYNMKSKILSTKNLIPGKNRRIDKLREEWINNRNNKLMFLTKVIGDIQASIDLGNSDNPQLDGESFINQMLSKLGVYKDVSAISKDLRAGGLGLVLDASSVIMKRLAKGKKKNVKFDHLFGHPRFEEFQSLFSDDITEAEGQ